MRCRQTVFHLSNFVYHILNGYIRSSFLECMLTIFFGHIVLQGSVASGILQKNLKKDVILYIRLETPSQNQHLKPRSELHPNSTSWKDHRHVASAMLLDVMSRLLDVTDKAAPPLLDVTDKAAPPLLDVTDKAAAPLPLTAAFFDFCGHFTGSSCSGASTSVISRHMCVPGINARHWRCDNKMVPNCHQKISQKFTKYHKCQPRYHNVS